MAFSFGVKLHQDVKAVQKGYAIVMGAVFILLPAICLLLGYFAKTDLLDAISTIVVSSLAAGTFIYIGSFEVLGHEFHHGSAATEKGAWGSTLPHRLMKLSAVFAGVLLVAMLALIPHHDVHDH